MTSDLSIGEAARHLGVSIDALRFYERAGVTPSAERDAGGRRRYGAGDLHLLEILLHLRDTGLPFSDIATFTRLVQRDPAGVTERLALLQAHRVTVLDAIARLTNSLDVIDSKISDYELRVRSLPAPGEGDEPISDSTQR